MPNGRTPDIASGRLSPEEYAREFQRPPSAARPARGLRRGRPLLFLLRRALRAGLPDRHRHPDVHPRDPDRQSEGRGGDDPLRRISSAACAPASARPRRCARRPASAKSAEGKPVRIGELQRYATDALMAEGRAALRAAPRRPASASPWSAAGRRGFPAPIASPCTAMTSSSSTPARKSAASTNTASPPTRRSTTSPQAEVDFVLSIGGITVEAGKALGRDFTLAELRARLRRGVPRHRPCRRQRARPCRGDARRASRTRSPTSPTSARRRTWPSLPVGRTVVVIGGGMTAIDIAVAVEAPRRRGRDHRLSPRRGEDGRQSDYERSWPRPTASRSSSTPCRSG